MKKITLIATIILLPVIAVAQIKSARTFTLRIKMNKADKNTRVYLAYQVDGKKIIDSATQRNGFYTFSGFVDQPLNATLVADNEGLGVQALIKRTKQGGNIDLMPCYIHPGVINIKTDKFIANAIFSGSDINADNERLKAMLKPIRDRQIIISNRLKQGNYIVDFKQHPPLKKALPVTDSLKINQMIRQLDSLKEAEKPVLKKFICANPHSYIALIALERYAGSFPDLRVIEPMYNNLSAAVRNTIAGKEYREFLFADKNLVVGSRAPDFVQHDTMNRPISLSSFKGRYVLLDFWASWCGPCRAASPELVQIFNQFRGKNFTILGISLDAADGRQAWLNAIKNDGMTWAQVSDLKHWDNQVAKLYGIRVIPQNFLINPEGIIIAKGLDSQQLRKKLEEVLTAQ